MKTVILCGGKGTRLADETEYRPKPLIEIGGKPILWHIMKIYEMQGFKDFVICLGYKGNMIKNYFLNIEEMTNDFLLDLKNCQKIGLTDNNLLHGRVWFAETGLNSMTGARVAKIKKYIGNDEDFFLTYGDGLGNVDLKKLYEHHKKMGKIATISVVRPVSRFGIVEVENETIKKFEEKPAAKDAINGGFMVFNKKFFDYLSDDENCILEQEPLKRLAQEGQLAAYEHTGFWKCMDNQKEVDELNQIYTREVKEKGRPPWENL